MTLDPKKLEAAIEQVRLEHANSICTIDGCTKLADICERAARADEMEAYNYELQSLLHDHGEIIKARDAEIAALKAELARFDHWQGVAKDAFSEMVRYSKILAPKDYRLKSVEVANYCLALLPTPPQAKEADHGAY